MPIACEAWQPVLLSNHGKRLFIASECFVQDLGMKYVRLDGSTAVSDRLTIVDRRVPRLL